MLIQHQHCVRRATLGSMPSTHKTHTLFQTRQIVVRLIQKDRQQAAAAHALLPGDLVTSTDFIDMAEGGDDAKAHAVHKLSEGKAGVSGASRIDADAEALDIDAQPTALAGASAAAGRPSDSDRGSDGVEMAGASTVELEEVEGEHSSSTGVLHMSHAYDWCDDI